MLNNKGNNQSSFPSSTMIPQQLLPTNLIENSLNVQEDNDGNTLSPISPMNTSSKLKKQYRKRKLSDKDLKKSASINSSFMGFYIIAEMGLPDLIKAISIQKSFLPVRKDLVPSIGSTISVLS